MPLHVSCFRADSNWSGGVRQVLSYESVALDGETAARSSSESNVAAYLYNSETAAVRVAWGTTPDATATAATSATTAAIVVGPNEDLTISLYGAEKIAVKALT